MANGKVIYQPYRHGKSYLMREMLKCSGYPDNFVPAGASTWEGTDMGDARGDMGVTVKGFYKDGAFHVQRVEYHKSD